jgi:hypothetical protein
VTTDQTRRRVLSLGAAALAGLAGCSGSERTADARSETTHTTADATATADSTATATVDSTAEEATSEATPTDATARLTATTPALDLREANVVGVTVDRRDGGVRFDVTLYHDDDGEDGYANWWQVETLAGERLGRRELAHPHGTREFTRSETVSIPSGTTCVVVRGHDQTHGYGGQAMVVNVETGATEAVSQGGERRSTTDRGC